MYYTMYYGKEHVFLCQESIYTRNNIQIAAHFSFENAVSVSYLFFLCSMNTFHRTPLTQDYIILYTLIEVWI